MNQENTQKVHLVSLGCPKNTVDSEKMLGLLDGNSYQITSEPEKADVVIVNTCGFIGPAKEESIDAVMAAHRLKEEGKCKGVIVTGCLATRYEEELRAELDEADALLTIDEEVKVVESVDQILNKPLRKRARNTVRKSMTPDHWGYLRISDGCDHKCAFCSIPAIRGPHKSEAVEDLLAEAERLASTGVRELVLISQDSVRYGADLYGRPALVKLLSELENVKGIEWIRLMYTYPAFWTEEMIDFYASSTKMCAYIDMPLQHISDRVLKRMKRATTRRKTIDLLQTLRSRIPGVGLRSTFIVGFPGETDEDFTELLQFVEDTRFDHLSGFIYSREEGTSAYDLDAEVAEEVKEYRYSCLTQLQERISTEINDDMVGSRHIVLVDDRDENGFYGRMQRDAPEIDGHVLIEKGGVTIGKFVEVEITGADPFQLQARAVGIPY
ncbi:MAG: 30S ribosomal protein S12 methylthiotransferase RimO [Gemmatimonadetes bacterium]|nr:30S ribosomal protein S12 methylthiotransferase RimO [Gemmatimonadota bacterium]